MTKKSTFYENNYEKITQVKCKIGLWFLSSALPLINIYVCTKFNFDPLCTFQDMTRTCIHYEKSYGLETHLLQALKVAILILRATHRLAMTIICAKQYLNPNTNNKVMARK